MKRAAISIAVLLVVWLVWTVQRSSSPQAQITRHQQGWWQAVRAIDSHAPEPLFDRLNPFRDKRYIYWNNERQFHEGELLRLGYLTNYELRLSNQTMTTALYSNFFSRVRAELGTNVDQVWVGNALPNRAGLRPMLPVKDTATWERLFRECALLYASNTSIPVQSAP